MRPVPLGRRVVQGERQPVGTGDQRLHNLVGEVSGHEVGPGSETRRNWRAIGPHPRGTMNHDDRVMRTSSERGVGNCWGMKFGPFYALG
jgi:hypothetical protein